jgi:glycosyltransferase involved in cell wall biosynthesis
LWDKVKKWDWIDREKLDDLYSRADCFLLTSNSEGWGLVAVEAAAHALPIIMTDVGLAGEVIKNEESGLIIPVGDKDKLVAAMERIINDAGLRQRLGQGALAAVKKLPSREDVLQMYLDGWTKAAKQK